MGSKTFEGSLLVLATLPSSCLIHGLSGMVCLYLILWSVSFSLVCYSMNVELFSFRRLWKVICCFLLCGLLIALSWSVPTSLAFFLLCGLLLRWGRNASSRFQKHKKYIIYVNVTTFTHSVIMAVLLKISLGIISFSSKNVARVCPCCVRQMLQVKSFSKIGI